MDQADRPNRWRRDSEQRRGPFGDEPDRSTPEMTSTRGVIDGAPMYIIAESHRDSAWIAISEGDEADPVE